MKFTVAYLQHWVLGWHGCNFQTFLWHGGNSPNTQIEIFFCIFAQLKGLCCLCSDMESLTGASEITGEGEGCSSTESGWTLYLQSPQHDHGNMHDDDDDDGGGGDVGEVDSDVSARFRHSTGESRAKEDDSLASDASTGNREKNGTPIAGDHVNHRDIDGYHSPDDGYSNHSTNIQEKVKTMKRKEGRRSFGDLFKSNGSSSSRSSKNWKTKLIW